MRFLGILALVALTACAQTPPPAVIDAPVFRDTSAQIASQADVTAERMAGTWFVRQAFAGQPKSPATLVLSELPDGKLQLTAEQTICRADLCEAETILVQLRPTGPGRWTPVGPQSILPKMDIWVMWMDFDSRTATLGTPSGEFGWIIDKSTSGGGDRINAARDIMDWFGYDVGRLTDVKP